jgi:hypothetical protein
MIVAVWAIAVEKASSGNNQRRDTELKQFREVHCTDPLFCCL